MVEVELIKNITEPWGLGLVEIFDIPYTYLET